MNILLVDDHQIVIDGLRTLLVGAPHTNAIFEANNGGRAMEMMHRHPIGIVLLDINLPDKNGFEICQDIKAEFPNTRIIALTMHSDAGYISRMIKAGVDGYLLKNTSKKELLEAIATVMRGEAISARKWQTS